MLNLNDPPAAELVPMSPEERARCEPVVPADHFLRRLLPAVDFQTFLPVLATAYSPDPGRRPLDPVVLLKLEVLARQDKLSDREVLAGARFHLAYRLFLGLSLQSPLPHPTVLTYFRQRLGPERMEGIFDPLVGQARRLGLVKDRLRLKDATHLIADIAIPSTIRLVAETRDQLLDALRPCAPVRVAEEEAQAVIIRQRTDDAKEEERLVQRGTHLRAVLAWADDVPTQELVRQRSAPIHESLRQALALAHKILADREAPPAGDQVRGLEDADARRGFHGGYFDGYVLDVAMEADSELLTAAHVVPGNGAEGADAAELIRHGEQVHHNDVAAVSIDGAGDRGPVPRELTDPAGLNLEVFTPPPELPPPTVFGPERFALTVLNAVATLTGPAGQTTQARGRSRHDNGWKYRLRKQQCAGCAVREPCLTNPQSSKGRTVTKNDFEAEYTAAPAPARTPAYAKVRREQPAIERKWAELVRRHDLRHARYRGRARVWYPGLLTGLVVNLKRLVRLLSVPREPGAGRVRAEGVGMG